MGDVIYYVAMSIDGMIAGPGGDLDWLLAYDHTGEDYGFDAMHAGIDASIMGAATYEWVLSHGAPSSEEEGPESIVVTTRDLPQPPSGKVRFTSESPEELVRSLKAKYERNIWLVGGGKLAAAFAQADLIDQYDLAVIPVVLGAGIPLVHPGATNLAQKLTLLEHQVFPSGVMRLRYGRRRAD
jgi:dihydrofolate reductase